MGTYAKYVKDELAKKSKEEVAEDLEEFKDKSQKKVKLLLDCVMLNGSDASPAVWTTAMMECILLLNAMMSQRDLDRFKFIMEMTIKQIKVNYKNMVEDWDNG